ncbi:D-glycero-alpha-D-manno-heptose-1,7-bisphosphate 7-phosphatase [Flammeovirga kamogawensis]|uniref:D,D-heptose 1,7-bisphosphate phosphatase n=1 Tax=Flammeovirga kamogawensis TaxID=373891 RepID=A0ABX8GSK5_9BACT|nr:HAD-IIIA family hydrolase [Flammeovirga kamogawensis]MBB6461497.1 D-glycero-D-manno-heptose 1,7-bisphosphate phosphatase [Flammeovirga kamogawensis]QWG06389.1 HAD-IIIA family hydrolase [Flammeovirga kamogawensis]TRX68218.1 HAD-IIIA family hydrolase [Flammeovirga kamogawensis]
MEKNKCVFLDRDGVLNKDYVDYAYTLEKFEVLPGVSEALQKLKDAGFKLVILTNQSGIVKGIYKKEDVFICHDALQKECNNAIDDMFYAPLHEKWSNSLSRKPGTLMFERAIYKYNADMENTWMIGDKERDLIPAEKVGIKYRIQVDNPLVENTVATHHAKNLIDAVDRIILADK